MNYRLQLTLADTTHPFGIAAAMVAINRSQVFGSTSASLTCGNYRSDTIASVFESSTNLIAFELRILHPQLSLGNTLNSKHPLVLI